MLSFLTALTSFPEVHATTTFTRVQGPTTGTGYNVNSFNVTLTDAPQTDTVLIATVALNTLRVQVNNITQTGVTWTFATAKYSATANTRSEIWFGTASAGASSTAVFNLNATHTNNNAGAEICEYSGINRTDPLDQTGSATGTGGVQTTTGTLTASPRTLWIGTIASVPFNLTGSPTNEYTYVYASNLGVSTGFYSAFLEKIDTPLATSTTSSNITSAGTINEYVGCIASFNAESYTYLYTFAGVYDENIDAGVVIGAANITAFFDDGTAAYVFELNETIVYSPSTKPLYFYYDIWSYANTSDTALHREYWLSPTENNGTFYVYGNQQGLENIVFTIRALGGAGLGSYVSVQRIIGGTLTTVEKRPVDSTGAVVMALQAFTLYTVSIEGTEPNTSTTFGNINTYTTPIVLTISALSFPSSTLQQYKYLSIWASRPTSTEIMVNYNDTNLQTVSVYYEISDANGTVHYNFTHTGENSFSDIWTSALANTTYYLDATVVQSTFGTTTFKQILAKDGTTASPIDLSFLGTWQFSIYGVTVSLDATQVFWALVVLIIFGSFSVLNAYMGAFAGVAAAAIFVGLGWLDIPVGAVALAFAFTVVIGIAVYKRRGN